MITLESKDYSFVEGTPVETLNDILNGNKIKPNLTQNAAISLFVCIDDIPEKIDAVASQASEVFDVQVEKNLVLLTIRHYTGEYLNRLTESKRVVLQQKTTDTIQMLMRDNQSIT